MTYRDDDAAAHAHLGSETHELERVRRERDRLRKELAQLGQLQEDLDAAVASRRGSAMSGRGYLRVAGLMIVMLAAGAVDGALRPQHAWAHYALLGVVTVGLGLSLFWADRKQKVIGKLLEEHDARIAARRQEPQPPNVRVADDVGADRVDEGEATGPRGESHEHR